MKMPSVTRTTVIGSAMLVLFLQAGMAVAVNDPYENATYSRQSVIGSNYFGMHFHRLVLNPGEKFLLTQWPDQLIGSIRLWDSGTRWGDIVPSGGQWNFGRMDTYVEQAAVHHVPILYVLGSTPRWASARPEERCPYGYGCAAEPVRMAHWEEYVRRVAQLYKGKISAYELWNEPFFSELKKEKGASDFYYGSVSNMVEMARIARKVLDEVDPKAILTTPGFTGNPNQLELFLSSGGKQYVQAVAYHFYANSTKQFADQVFDVRAIMKRQGLERDPLWNTETGIEVNPQDQFLPLGMHGLTRTEAASRMVQYLVFGAAAGLERYYYYAWDNGRSGMLSAEGVRLPAMGGYIKAVSWLLGATMHGCKTLLPNGVRCQGTREGKNFMIVWADKEANYSIPVPSGQKVASVEKLFDSSPQRISLPDRTTTLMLGSEPVQLLLENTK